MDASKIIVVIFVLVIVILKGNKLISPKNLFLIYVGLGLFFLSAILDFTDDFPVLDNVVIIGRNYFLHDFLEDQITNTLGFLIFAWGALDEIMRQKR